MCTHVFCFKETNLESSPCHPNRKPYSPDGFDQMRFPTTPPWSSLCPALASNRWAPNLSQDDRILKMLLWTGNLFNIHIFNLHLLLKVTCLGIWCFDWLRGTSWFIWPYPVFRLGANSFREMIHGLYSSVIVFSSPFW